MSLNWNIDSRMILRSWNKKFQLKLWNWLFHKIEIIYSKNAGRLSSHSTKWAHRDMKTNSICATKLHSNAVPCLFAAPKVFYSLIQKESREKCIEWINCWVLNQSDICYSYLIAKCSLKGTHTHACHDKSEPLEAIEGENLSANDMEKILPGHFQFNIIL